MRKFPITGLLLVCGYLLVSCNGQLQSNNVHTQFSKQEWSVGYEWTELTNNASFPKSYNFQLFATNDIVWAFHPDGNWYSLNGKEWIKSQLTNSIYNLAFLNYVQFNNAILGLGHFEGNIEKFKLTTPIYKTTDMKNWAILSEKSNLPERFFYHPFVFNNTLWIIGGSNGTDQFSDIWNSDDGVSWIKRADNLPFGKRDGSQFVVFNNKIFMLNNDVWSSTDGLNWSKEADAIVSGENIFGYAAVVYDNHIWLLGCNRNEKFKSEILVSPDGKNWTAQRAPWSPRGGIAACVFKGKIIMTGGKYGGPGIEGQTEFVYSNDVWSLEKATSTGMQ
jgi:hypothetical protein